MLIIAKRIPVLAFVLVLSHGLMRGQAIDSRAQLKIQLGHSSITSVAFSRDGRWIITGGRDNSAILWDVVTGRELRRFTGHTDSVSSVAFSPDGHLALTGSYDHSARVWDTATGKEIRRFEGHTGRVRAVAFSADGQRVLTGGGDNLPRAGSNEHEKHTDHVARLWDIGTGQELLRFDGHLGGINCVAFSPDDRRVLTGSEDGTARLWDVRTAKETRSFTMSVNLGADVLACAFSSDGRWIVTGIGNSFNVQDRRAQLWNVETGKEGVRLEGGPDSVDSVAFSPDGKWIASWSSHWGQIRLSEATTGREIRRFGDRSLGIGSVTFSPDGRSLLTGIQDRALLLDVQTGKEIQRFEGHSHSVNSLAFSANGLQLLAAGHDEVVLWDLTSGKELHRLEGLSDDINAVSFAPNGRWAAGAGHVEREAAVLWDLITGQEIRHFAVSRHATLWGNFASAITFSHDGHSVLIGIGDGTLDLCDVISGAVVREFTGHSRHITSVVFSADGRSALTSSKDHTARLWDVAFGNEILRFEGVESAVFVPPDSQLILVVDQQGHGQLREAATGMQVREFQGHTTSVRPLSSSIAISPDGQMAIGSDGSAAYLWDPSTGREIRTLMSPTGAVWSAVFSPDSRFALVGSEDGTARFFEVATGRLLVTVVSFRDGGWAVVDPEGRYDASDPDNSPGLYWLLGDEVIELKQLKERFYTPGLLARALGLNKEPLPAVAGLDHLQLWPTADVIPPKPGENKAIVRLANRGGGIGNVVVKVNGREIPLNVRNAGIDPNSKTAEIKVDLTAAELAPDGKNQIEVIAYERNNLVSGRGFRTNWERTPAKPAAPPTLHAIIAGVSSFENAKLNLAFAADDALDIAHALRVGGAHLFGVDHVDLKVFATGTGNEPTKQNIARAFEEVARSAGANDVVLVYFAGHGVAGKSGSDLYYFLTREARSVEPANDPELRAATTVSSEELLEWLRRKGMPLRQVVVLDTCAAGQAAAELVKLTERRELTADQRRAIELLKDRTGSHILMGAAADAVSYEASRYGQGLLTYALLSGMRGEALDEGGRLEVRKWFDTAERRVPDLAQGIGGIQKPVIASLAGQSFPIALLTRDDFPKIPLKQVKPQLVRAICLDEDDADQLQLGPALRAELRAASMPTTRGDSRREQALVYLDQVAGDVADAYVPQVRYWVEPGKVRLRLRLLMGDQRQERTLGAATHDPAELARLVTREFVAMLQER